MQYIINEDNTTLTAKEVIDFLSKIPENTPLFVTTQKGELNPKTTLAYKLEYLDDFKQAFIIGYE